MSCSIPAKCSLVRPRSFSSIVVVDHYHLANVGTQDVLKPDSGVPVLSCPASTIDQGMHYHPSQKQTSRLAVGDNKPEPQAHRAPQVETTIGNASR